jgi:AcrR family transcriptional regulator
MVTETDPAAQPRIPLSKERVLRAAITVADEGGIEALTMRHLAEELGVEAMSLYYHVANKEALLDGVVDAIVDEIAEIVGGLDMPNSGDWKTALRRRILVAREVMLRHPWAPGVLETRTTMSLPMMRYFDGLLGVLIEGGFSYDLGHQAMHAIGSRALGFTREMFQPDDEDQADEDATVMMEQMADELPYMVGMMQAISHPEPDPDSTLGWCDYQAEFEFALDLTLDGLERLRQEA